LALMPYNSRAVEVDPFGFRAEDYSSWGIVDAPYPFEGYDKEGNHIGHGCFPVGNGLVFAHLGVNGDFNTLRGITGPGYQTRDEEGKAVWWQAGEWPDMRPRFILIKAIKGEIYVPQIEDADKWKTQSIQVLKGMPIVRIIQRSDHLSLYSLTYALPGFPAIVREYCLVGDLPEGYWPGMDTTVPNLICDEHGDWAKSGKAYMHLSEVGNPQWKRLLAEGDRPESGQAISRMFEIDELSVPAWYSASIYVFNKDQDERGIPGAPGTPDLRTRTYDFWQSWSAKSRQFDTGDKRLDDMLTQIPVIIETQRDAYSGGVSPMVSYHGYWVRDHNGPILMYLDNGRFEEVMRMLRYHRAACWHYKHCWMQVPLDLDLRDLSGWQSDAGASIGRGEAMLRPDGTTDQEEGRSMASPLQALPTAGDLSQIGIAPEDWEGVTVEQAEVPSWIVLQHYWLWQAMRDAGWIDEANAFIREAWPFITHNLFAMPVDPEYGVKFHGDETYTGGALYSTYDREDSGAIGYPSGYIPTDFFSFDNTLLMNNAASAVVQMANSLGLEHYRERAKELQITVNQALGAYDRGNYWAPAVSPVTGQEWPTAFSNICLRPCWLGNRELHTGPPAGSSGTINRLRGPVTMAEHYDWTLEQLWQMPYPATTPWSSQTTGHNLGYWLSAATSQGDHSHAIFAAQLLLATADPEGAFCEILDADGQPVNIYGRINRIRPWESGINYHALVQYLDKQTGWQVIPAGESIDEADSVQKPLAMLATYPYPMTEVLVLTTDQGYLERLAEYAEFAAIDPDRIEVWDAGLPFSVTNLYAAAVGPDNTIELFRKFRGDSANDHIEIPNRLKPRIPRLFIDSGVRDGLDRRTFKDHDFWYGKEMTQLLAEYEELGGVVIDADRAAEETP